MHGVLDLSTLGLWEAIGTPIEGSMNEKEFFVITVTYDNENKIERVDLK